MDSWLLDSNQYELIWEGAQVTLQILLYSFLLGLLLSLVFGVRRVRAVLAHGYPSSSWTGSPSGRCTPRGCRLGGSDGTAALGVTARLGWRGAEADGRHSKFQNI